MVVAGVFLEKRYLPDRGQRQKQQGRKGGRGQGLKQVS